VFGLRGTRVFERMNRAYDVFMKRGDHEPIWIGTFIGLEHLKNRITMSSVKSFATYLVYDPIEAKFIEALGLYEGSVEQGEDGKDLRG
jgi:hypothetical protein